MYFFLLLMLRESREISVPGSATSIAIAGHHNRRKLTQQETKVDNRRNGCRMVVTVKTAAIIQKKVTSRPTQPANRPAKN